MIKTGTRPAFSFVPHRAGTTRDDRRFINTHLSHRAAERRKRGKSRSKCSPTIIPEPAAPTVQLPHTQKVDETEKELQPSPRNREHSAFERRPLSVNEERPEELNSEIDELIISPKLLIASIDGKCDPFASTLIPMSTPVRALLRFNNDIFQPWGENIEKGMHKKAAFSNKFFQTGNQLLQDRTTGYAFLARLASMAATLTSSQQLAMIATGFKSQAYENLQQHLLTHGMESGTLLYSQMFSFLAMEIAAHNFDAAAIHARTLQQLIQNAPVTDCVNVGEDLICSVLWHECLRGGFSLGRPAFKVDSLLDQAFMRNTLSEAKTKLAGRGLMPPETTNGFRKAGLAQDVATCVGELRFMSDLTYAFERAPDLVTEDIMRAFGHRSPLISSQLLTLYNDAQEHLVDGAFPGHKTELHTAAATCLAARFWYRVATSHEWVDVPPTAGFQVYRIYGTHKPILKRLREAHEAYQESGEQSRKQNLWLWILYVGTLAERANTTPDQAPKQKRGAYFNLHFVSLAKELGLFSWPDIEDVLSAFLYSDAVGVRSRLYFEEGMRSQVRG